MSSQFRYLFTPIKMRGVTIANRLVNAPHGTRMIEGISNYPTEQLAYYLAERAKGGVGLIVVGVCTVHPTGLVEPRTGSLMEDGAIPHHRLVTDMVHQYPPTKIFAQLAHNGREGTSWVTKLPQWGPSAVPDPFCREVPHEMEVEEIDELVEAFARAAGRAISAGYDGIEIHAGHGYLLDSFMSKFSNKRVDEYGGSLENRMRLTFRVIDAIRAEIGEAVPFGIRIVADEFVDGGLTLEETTEIAKRLEATGKIDYISASQGIYPTVEIIVPEMSFPMAAFVPLQARIKEAVENIPVMVVGRINDPVLAEKILADGQGDMIGMARPLIADPELPNKAKEGRLDEIRTCNACNVGCRGGPHRGMSIMCLQNPAVGHEKELGIGTMKSAQVRKKVMVVGGGPGGLKAAEVAAERGHQVTLYEKSNELGGQVLIAAKAPTRDDFAGCVRYFVTQIERLGVKVNLGIEVTPELVEEEKPDAVVVATGSTPDVPPIPGADGDNVFNTWQVLNEEVEIGDRVIIVDSGESAWKFCITADFLAQRGKKVEMITSLASIGAEIDVISRPPILRRLRNNGVEFTCYTAVKAINGHTVTVADAWTGEERNIDDVDSVVFAWYHRANNSLYHSLKGRVKELHAAGDCVAPRKAIDAIREGFIIGRRL